MQHIDWSGLGVLVAAFAAAFVSIGTFLRAGKVVQDVGDLHKMVNSQQTALNAVAQAAVVGQARAEGKAEGVAEERGKAT